MKYLRNFLRKMKGKRGGSTLLEILVSLGLITFVMFFPVVSHSLTQKESMLEDILATTMQMVSIEGGLTDRVEDIIFLNLEAKGLIPKDSHNDPEIREKIKIMCNADARNGATENLIYRDDPDSKIYIEIWYPANLEVRLINGLSKIIGAGEDTIPFSVQDDEENWYYKHKGYILSEKINY